jgi:hypothetical protein
MGDYSFLSVELPLPDLSDPDLSLLVLFADRL